MTPGGVRIEPAGPAHAALLAELHRRCFQQGGWNPTEMLALIDAFGAFALIGLKGEEPAGLALARVVADEGEVLALGVLAEQRRRGIGRALLSTLMGLCAERGTARLFLEVAVDNAAALALYRAAGFSVVGRRAGYYASPDRGPVDGLILARSLAKPCAGGGDAADADRSGPRRPQDLPPRGQ